MEVQVALYLLSLFAQQHGEQVTRTEPAAKPGPQSGIRGRLRLFDPVAVLSQQLAPHLDVPLLDAGQLDVDVFPVGIGLLAGQRQVQIGCVRFVLPMVEPFFQVSGGHAASYYLAMPYGTMVVHWANLATIHVVMASYNSDMTVAFAVPDVIVARAQAGDEAALEALYRAFEVPVYNQIGR